MKVLFVFVFVICISTTRCFWHIRWFFNFKFLFVCLFFIRFRFLATRQPRGPDGSSGFKLDRGSNNDIVDISNKLDTIVIAEEEMNEEQAAATPTLPTSWATWQISLRYHVYMYTLCIYLLSPFLLFIFVAKMLLSLLKCRKFLLWT